MTIIWRQGNLNPNFPRVYAGRRKRLVWRLLANGAAQAAVAFSLAYALRSGLESARSGVLNWPIFVVITSAGFFVLALRVIEAVDAERLGQDYVMRVRLRMFKRIASRPVHTDKSGRWGVTMTRMISDLNSLRNWVAIGIARAVVAGITLFGLLATLSFFNPTTGATMAVLVLVCLGVSAALTPALRRNVREARRRRGRLANNLGEKVLAFQTVRHFGQTSEELNRVRSHSQRLRDALVRRIRTAQFIRILPEVTLPIAIGAVVALTAFSLQAPEDTAVTILLIGMVTASLSELARSWDYRLSFEEGRRRIGEILAGPQIKEASNAALLSGSLPLSVSFKEVYAGRNVGPFSFAASAGETVRVSGPTGSGKSMLLMLAARFLDPTEGEIRLNDEPLTSINIDSLQEAVQLVAPELPLLRGTISENLNYGLGREENAWIEKVADVCGLNDEPVILAEGLDARVEEQGKNLPQGLRARIALARAAVMRPRLLLIDDTSFVVDEQAGAALREVVDLLGATTLIVSNEEILPVPVDKMWQITLHNPRADNEVLSM